MTDTKHKEHITSEHFGIPADFADRAENYAAWRVQALSEQLADAQALIEASRKQEPAAWELFFDNGNSNGFTSDKGEAAEFGENKRPLYSAPVVAPSEPDMFWDADDNEKMHTSISELLNDEICNGTPLEIGAIFTIQQAKRLPDIRIKVTSIDDNECEADYEVIEAVIGGAA